MGSKKKGRNKNRVLIISGITLFAVGAVIGIFWGLNAGHKQEVVSEDESREVNEVSGAMKDGVLVDYEKDGSLTLDNYIGIKATVTPTKEDVYRSILTEIEDKKIKVSGEERVKKGDWVIMDYAATIDGVADDDLEETGIVIQVGSGDLFNADFERKLTGLLLGEEYNFDVTFPDDYFDLDVAGQKVTFTVTIDWKFNEAFVEPLSKDADKQYKTVDEYYAYAKARERQENVDNIGDTVWDEYVGKCKVKKYPEGSKKQAYADLKKQYEAVGELSGISYEEVIAGWGMTEDDVKDLAKDEVKGRMIAKTIAVKENLELSDQQYREYLLEEVSVDEDKDPDPTIKSLEKQYKEETSAYPKDDMLIKLVKEFIGKNAKQE